MMKLKEHLRQFRDEAHNQLIYGRFYEDPTSPKEVAEKLVELCDLLISHIDDPKPRTPDKETA